MVDQIHSVEDFDFERSDRVDTGSLAVEGRVSIALVAFRRDPELLVVDSHARGGLDGGRGGWREGEGRLRDSWARGSAVLGLQRRSSLNSKQIRHRYCLGPQCLCRRTSLQARSFPTEVDTACADLVAKRSLAEEDRGDRLWEASHMGNGVGLLNFSGMREQIF